MTDYNIGAEKSEDSLLKSQKKWERICKASNIILSIIYALYGWLFGLFGLMLFSLGFPEASFSGVCAFLATLLVLLIPVFCVLGIVFSVRFRKKKSFSASLWVQLLPFGILGVALVLFLFSIV